VTMYPAQPLGSPCLLQRPGRLQQLWLELRTVPGFILLVLASTLYAGARGPGIGGFAGSGVAWIVPFSFAALCLLRPRPAVVTPLLIWAPWLAVVIANAIAARDRAEVQRSVMFLCPMIVGFAVAACRVGPRQLAAFLFACKVLAVLIWLAVLLRSRMVLGAALLGWGVGGAGLAMTTALLGVLFVVEGVIGKTRSFLWWLAMVAIPTVMVTRTGIVVSMLVLPLAAAPMKWCWRLVLICVGGVLLLGAFMLPKVQEKMFFSGHGELADLRWDNPDLNTHARRAMWDAMLADIVKRPWFGYGPGAEYAWMEKMDYGGLTHPHNDWLRLLYDYGIIGVATFLFCASVQIYHLFRIARGAVSVEVRILAYAGVTSFVALFLFMITDNIINYPNFFGNLQFTIIGLVYAAGATASTTRADLTLSLTQVKSDRQVMNMSRRNPIGVKAMK